MDLSQGLEVVLGWKMNGLPGKALSSEILFRLMGSNPQINGLLRVSEHMYVCVGTLYVRKY